MIINPLVNLIWLAGLVFVVGSLIAISADAREQRWLERGSQGQEAAASA